MVFADYCDNFRIYVKKPSAKSETRIMDVAIVSLMN